MRASGTVPVVSHGARQTTGSTNNGLDKPVLDKPVLDNRLDNGLKPETPDAGRKGSPVGFRLANVDGRAVLVHGDGYHDVAHATDGALGPEPIAALAAPDRLAALAATLDERDPTGKLAEVVLGPPVPNPEKCFGIGLNYQSHADEAEMDVPENPLVFTKFPSCLVGPTADVHMRSDGVDYEGELVVVIGTPGKDIPVDRAWEHVVGLTAGQDISDRPAQFSAQPPHFDLGKSFDTYGPLGPWVVSLDAFDDPDDLHLTTTVNGEVRQDDTTASLIFDVSFLVSYLSHITTLTTGDLIYTGTPEGIGMSQGKLLVDGDEIVTTIEGIGSMANRCVRVSDWR